MQALQPRDPGAGFSWVLAITVHVVLFAVLFFGIRWKTKQADPVMAELWSQLPAVEQPRPPEPPPPPRVEPKPPPPKPEPAPEPKVEPKPAPKPDIALEQERKKKEEADRKKLEEEKKKREEAEKKKQEELRAKEEKERREKELAEKRRLEDENRRRVLQDELKRDLAVGLPPKPQVISPQLAGDAAALNSWQNQIQAKIRSNIVLPPDLAGNPQAEFDVALLPTGEVLSVKLARSSGNRALDDAWERAILKSSPLPRPAKAEVFVRDLRLKFRPSE
jgi:colicin import membrane protein